MEITRTISDEATRRAAIATIRGLDLTEGAKTLRVTEFKKQRSVAQNRLYHKWCAIIAADLGYSSGAEIHEELKYRFAVTILIRDDQKYAEGVEALKIAISRADGAEAETLRKFVIRLTSTTAFGVRQMSEYMTAVHVWAAEMNITLEKDASV